MSAAVFEVTARPQNSERCSNFGLDRHPPVTFHSKMAPILATMSGLAAILPSSSLKTSAVAMSSVDDEGKAG